MKTKKNIEHIGNRCVPNLIHQIVGPNQNEMIKRCLNSWTSLTKSNFKIKIWNDDLLDQFIKEEFPFALQAFRNARNHGEASDIARYLLVYKFGGVYVDWDIELFSVSRFLKLHSENPFGYLLYDPLNATLASEHFSAPAFEQYLLKLTMDIVETYNRDERDLMGTPQYSGPYRMRSSFRRHPCSKQSIIPVKDVFEFDYTEIRKVEMITKTEIMIHYWSHSWLA